MGSVPTSRGSFIERPCAAFVEGVLTGVFIGVVVAVALATPIAHAATNSSPGSSSVGSAGNSSGSSSLKALVAQSDQRLPSYDCQQARRNYEGAAAIKTSSSRDLDLRRNAMHVVCSFRAPNSGATSLNNMSIEGVDVMPNHRVCRDSRDLNCFRR